MIELPTIPGYGNGVGSFGTSRYLPSLDLAFALDKTLTARRGPTPAFTRTQSSPTGTTYIGSDGLIKYAASNEPRFDHDPITGVCKGLLIEEQRTNLVFPSDALTTQTRTVTAVAHTLSFYGAGTVVLTGAHIATVTGTGAFPTRTVLTFTPTAGSLTLTVTGSVTQAQLEAGSFPTSYIPTTSAPVIRNADVCSITGSDFTSFYNQSEGTVVCRAVSSNGIGTLTQYPWSISDSGINNMMIVYRATSSQLRQCRFASFVSVSDQLSDSNNAGLLADNATDTIGFAIKVNDFAGSLDGNLITDNTVSLPTVDRMFIGSRVDGTRHWGGHISRIQYFRKRLSNAKLQQLTL